MASQPRGLVSRAPDDLTRAQAGLPVEGDQVVLTFVVDEAGQLLVTPRRSEHVACAGGSPVRAAGELLCEAGGTVVGSTNQSTGYCPEPSSWFALRQALDAAGIRHPVRYTREFLFRRCPSCGERNIVKDDWFVCALCDGELPAEWNF